MFCFFINTADSYRSHEDLAQEIARQLQSVVSAQVMFTGMCETGCVCIYYYEWSLFLVGLIIIVLCIAIAEPYKLKVVFLFQIICLVQQMYVHLFHTTSLYFCMRDADECVQFSFTVIETYFL